ncbi:hypothetical protein [Leptospira idonii]|uniref:Uncharacterized protein n=1 Tax=Leptospira idonii TaxID=1193500 RepID=A0A4R9M020_9LEPT|nr:hypothetical protein [Leptospira idonii]TGN18559.1 hypothetical protein EHS15_14330 [Leptospira idonii]
MNPRIKLLLFFTLTLSVLFYGFLYAYQLPILISSSEDSKVILGLAALVGSWIPPILGWIFKDQILKLGKETHEK